MGLCICTRNKKEEESDQRISKVLFIQGIISDEVDDPKEKKKKERSRPELLADDNR